MFKDFMEKFNSAFPENTGYYEHTNGLERWEPKTDFLCNLLFEDGYEILARRTIDFDSEKDMTEEEVVFQADDGKYFITVTNYCNGLQSSKIYPVTDEKEVTTTEYTIKTGQKKPITIKNSN